MHEGVTQENGEAALNHVAAAPGQQLAASGEAPGPDLDHAGAPAVTGGSAEPRG